MRCWRSPPAPSIVQERYDTVTTRDARIVEYTFEHDSSGAFGDDLGLRRLGPTDTIRRFRAIDMSYRLFGDDGLLSSTRLGRRLTRVLSDTSRRPLPGWYDIHAYRPEG